MYSNNLYPKAIVKFNDFIDNYLNTLREKLESIITSLSYEEVINKIKESRNLEDILAAKDVLISLDTNMADKFKILEFFIANNALDIEQVFITINSIFDSNIIKNYSHNLENELEYKNKIEESLKVIEQVKEDSDFDFSSFLKLLESSNLSEEEKIAILSQKAFESCSMEKESSKTPKLSPEERQKLDKLTTTYHDLEQQINDLINLYYSFIEGKNDNELAYSKALAANFNDLNEMITQEDPEQQMKYLTHILTAKIITLINEKKLIEDLLKFCHEQELLTKDIEEELQIHFLEVNDLIASITDLGETITKDLEEELNNTPANIIFLLDIHEKPYFNIQNYSNEDKKKIANLIERMQQGLKLDNQGIKHTKLITKNKLDYDVFINRQSNMYCSYIRLNLDTVLIITFGDKDSIYSDSESIVRKNYSSLFALKNSSAELDQAKNNPQQKKLITEIKEYQKGKENV